MGMEFLDGDLTFQDMTQLELWKFPASGQVPRNNDPNRWYSIPSDGILTGDEEWTPNLPFDSNKPMWNDEESEDNIDSENEEDFLDKIVEEEKPGVNPRKYRNKGWYVALMRMAIEVGDDPLDEDWVPKKTRKKLRKENWKKSALFTL